MLCGHNRRRERIAEAETAVDSDVRVARRRDPRSRSTVYGHVWNGPRPRPRKRNQPQGCPRRASTPTQASNPKGPEAPVIERLSALLPVHSILLELLGPLDPQPPELLQAFGLIAGEIDVFAPIAR